MITIDGLATGLDTQSILEGLLSARRAQIDRISITKQEIETEQSAFQQMRSGLTALQNQTLRLGRAGGELFDAKIATSSDEDIVAVSASDDAAVGFYSLRVKSLAHAHQIASQSFDSDTSEIGQGSLSIQVGNREAIDVTIDDSNDTLQGLAQAINDGSQDVTAAVINTGSTEGAYRLLLTSQHTGAANEITVDGTLSEDVANGIVAPTFDMTVQAATDAAVQFGSSDPDDPDAPEPIVAVSETSFMDDVLPGVTLDLRKADVDQEISITVEADGEAIRSGISGFVDAYNDVSQFINENSKYNAETESAGIFLGSRDASSIQSTLRDTLSTVMRGVDSEMNRLSAIGIRFGANGILEFDQSRLDDVINGTNDRVTLDDVRRLFIVDGQASSPGIEFLSGSHHTKASELDADGNLIPIDVDITSAARRAILTADNPMSAVTVDDTNNRLELTIDGLDLSLNLAKADYTEDELIEHLMGAVNGHAEIGGRELFAEIVDGNLQLTSASYGSLSKIEIRAAEENSAHELFGFSGGESATGQDVNGVFLLPDGTSTELATGQGRLLTGREENEFTRDVRLRVTMKQEDVVVGSDAELTITRGIAGHFDQALRGMLEGEFSNLNRIDDAFKRQIESVDDSIDRLNRRFEAREASLVAQFNRLELAVSDLQSVGQSLASSLGSVSIPTS